MSQVNLNEDYLKLMGIYPTTGNSRNLAALGGIVSVSCKLLDSNLYCMSIRFITAVPSSERCLAVLSPTGRDV